jgi:hypothetical protein
MNKLSVSVASNGDGLVSLSRPYFLDDKCTQEYLFSNTVYSNGKIINTTDEGFLVNMGASFGANPVLHLGTDGIEFQGVIYTRK